MARYVFDIETNGLLDQLDRVHSLVLQDVDTGQIISATDDENSYISVHSAAKKLMEADEVIGHNIIKFDIPALQKVYPGFKPKGRITDTLVLARLCWPDIKDNDFRRVKRKQMPGYLIGSYGLEAFGCRMGNWKGDYAKVKADQIRQEHRDRGEKAPLKDAINTMVWAEWSKDMQDYCEQDVVVTAELYQRCLDKNPSPAAVALEHEVATLCAQIERNGFPFDEAGAALLYAKLSADRQAISEELKNVFGWWWEYDGLVEPKRTIRYKDPDKIDRVAGEPWTKIKKVHFNPASRDHIANRLKHLYGWKPKAFTPNGAPMVDEEILSGLDYPEAKLLTKYFLLNKRIGQIAEGKQAWLKVCLNGFIHGSINSNAAVTRRATHSYPNLAQVPGVKAPHGKECRQLFGVTEAVRAMWSDAIMVGTDKSGLELRGLAHFMAKYDNGAYGEVILGGDIHWANVIGLGLVPEGTERYAGYDDDDGEPIEIPIHELYRNAAKTFIYGFLYGAGDEKVGRILYDAALTEESLGLGASIRERFFDGKRHVTPAMMKKVGKVLKANFLAGFPALSKLIGAVQKAAYKGYILSLDKQPIPIRKAFAALNTLLQSAGALACKIWMVELNKALIAEGYRHGWDGDFAMVAWVHDELQFIARNKEVADAIARLSPEVAKRTGEHLGFRCPLTADSKPGQTWADCH